MTDNYIQVEHTSELIEGKYTNSAGVTTETEVYETDTYFAVISYSGKTKSRSRTISDTHADAWPEWKEDDYNGSWLLNGGQPVYISAKADIAGYRKLLDELEKRMVD